MSEKVKRKVPLRFFDAYANIIHMEDKPVSDNNDNSNTAVPEPVSTPAPTTDSATVDPVSTADTFTEEEPLPTEEDVAKNIITEVVDRINESNNILIALSSNPSVDELSAAIGLSLFLDKLDKRTTAIYSGATPNALEFLKPEETFETTTDTLQDFVIALNKEKADHLRYKLDGEFVKIFITPYRTRISEDDLDFSYGDFNVDLVLALDVANGVDLDSALREHGRIMHDATIINITTGNPGKLGEIEWSDKNASSISEMVAKLLYNFNKLKIEKDEATAFLTGIVAATNRFSNAKTTPDTMQIASQLMESGADQQLIAKNITSDTENEVFSVLGNTPPKKEQDNTDLDIQHGETKESEEEAVAGTEPEITDETKEPDNNVAEKDNTLLNDLKAAEESLSQAGAETTPELGNEPLKINSEGVDSESNSDISSGIMADSVTPEGTTAENTATPETTPSNDATIFENPEKVIQPSEDFSPAPPVSIAPPTNENPAAAVAPAAPTNPEINGVPEINYMPMPGEEVLPPPPTPPIDTATPTLESTPPTTPAVPTVESEPVQPIMPATPVTDPSPEPLGPQPAMQDQVYTPQAADPGAFKIPGM